MSIGNQVYERLCWQESNVRETVMVLQCTLLVMLSSKDSNVACSSYPLHKQVETPSNKPWPHPSTTPTIPHALQWWRRLVTVNLMLHSWHILTVLSGSQAGARRPRGLASTSSSSAWSYKVEEEKEKRRRGEERRHSVVKITKQMWCMLLSSQQIHFSCFELLCWTFSACGLWWLSQMSTNKRRKMSVSIHMSSHKL